MKINRSFVRGGRKFISVALCLVMMLTTFFIFDPSVLNITASAAAWSGSTSASSGTDYTVSGSTLHIKTPNGMAWFINSLGTYASYTVYLDNDIDLGGSNQWVRNSTEFKGTFDGQNHTISRMNAYCGYREDLAGLFLQANGATFKNIKFDNCFAGTTDGGYGKDTWYGKYGLCVGYAGSNKVTFNNITVTSSRVSGRTRIGGLIGEAETDVEFTNCNVSCRVTGVRLSGNGSKSLNYWNGGLVGRTNGNLTATNCTYSNATYDGETTGIVGRQQSGSIVGLCEGGSGKTFKIENCYNAGTISNSGDSPKCAGGFGGEVKAGTIQIINCTNNGTVSNTGDHTGGFIGYSEGTITISGKFSSQSYTNNGNISGSSYVGGTIGYASGASSLSFTNCTNNGTVSAGGTDAGGILGKTEGYVKTFSSCHNTGTITVSGSTAGGMFGYVKGDNRGSTVMKVTGCTNTGAISSTGSNYVGGLVGSSDMPVNISGGSNTGKITGGQYVGGIAGIIKNGTITITDSNNTGTIYARSGYVGGIAGNVVPSDTAGVTIKNCKNTATSFTANGQNVGGILGKNESDKLLTVENCHNTSVINVSQNWIGGLVGYDKGELIMRNSSNTANVTGRQYTGGLIAGIEDDGCTITNCLNTGAVSTSGNSNGAGIVATVQSQTGSATWTISNTVNTGNISGASALGGFIGYLGNTDEAATVNINNSVNKGNVTSTGNDAGGFVGNIDNHGSTTQHHKFTNLYNYGNVSSSSTGDTFIGGIVGKEYGFCEFSGCENYGKVTETATSGNNIAGGIVGWIQDDTSSVQNCLNYGEISGRNNVGGIVGEFSSGSSSNLTIKQCGNYGTLVAKNAGNTQIGGIMGRFNGNTIYISKCFNGNGTDGTIASSSAKGLYAGGIIGYGTTIYIADSYNNAPAVYGNTAGGLVGYRNSSAYIYNSYYATKTGVTNYVGSGSATTTRSYNSSTIAKGTTVISTLNTSGSVTGIGTIGNAYAYKQNVNQSYPVLSWQVNTLTKNVGRNLIADLIADTAKSGFTGTGSTYSIKLDGVTKTYYPTYTKVVNGITIKFNSKTDEFTIDGTWTPTASSVSFVSIAIPSTVQAYLSIYYIGGLAASATTYVSDGSTNYTVGRTSSSHKSVAVTAGRSFEIMSYVTNGMPVKFDNYKFHASLDYVNNVTGSSEASADLHATYPDLGTPSKTGYNFLGWFDQRSGGAKIASGSTVVNSGTPGFNDVLDRDVDIYANWDPITYTIKYDGNGATSGSTASSTHTYDEAKNLTSNGFKRELNVNFDYNYSGSTATTATATSTFNGWLCDKDGKTYADGASVINLTTVDKDTVTMTAQWIAGSVTMPTPSRTGYKFEGWYTAAEGGTEVTGSTFTPDENNITLYAQWTPITYTVSYDGNGATGGSTASSTHTYDEAKNLTSNGYTREFTVTFDYNYSGSTATTATATSIFNGWAKSADGEVEYADGAGVTNLSATDGDNITLFAKWTDVSVTFPTPTRTGYDFSGWFTADGNKFESSTEITEDITLYAEWSIKSYKVTFVNGSTVLQESDWEYGSEPKYNGDTPTQAPTAECEYVFSGWSPAITAVTGDATYTAQFTEKAHEFKYTPVDKKYHKHACASCGYEMTKEAHHFETVEYSDKYVSTCIDCGKVIEAVKYSATMPSGCTVKYSIKPTVTPEYAIATIVAPMQKGDTYFVYWVDGEGNIVGTYRTYSFFVTGKCDFTPVYVSIDKYTAEREKATSISRVTGGKGNGDGTYTIYTEHSVSTTVGSITGHGVIYTTNSSYANSLTIDNDNVTKKAAVSSATTLTGLLAVSDKFNDGDTVWARSYIIDANGDTQYGAVKELTVTASDNTSEIGTLSCESFDLTAINAENDAPTDPADDTPTEQSPIEKIMSILSKLVDFIKKILEFFKISEVIK